MSVQASTGLVITQNAAPEVVRRSANFHPSIWGDRFSAFTSDADLSSDASVEKYMEEVKAEVRRKLVAAAERPSQKLNLIDAIQRLGLAYHFKTEVEKALDHVYFDENIDDDSDLFQAALRFRLLRQHGYHVSCDMFNKFTDKNGNWKEALIGDVQGMLSLYEATHLRVHGEEILDQALDFCVTHLQSLANNLSSSPLATQIINALKQPIHKGMPRLQARQYISIYQQQDSHDETLLRLAKLDFNLLQKIHQKELSEISKWWKDLDFVSKLPFARDRVVECYFWILGVYFEPEYYLARKILTKVIAMTSIIDDIYDVYGTIDELVLFTEAVERWDMSTFDQLPEYMKICYQALLDVYKEIEEETAKQGTSYRLYYAKEAMKMQVRAYSEEAKWFGSKYVPTMEEYMRVALVTSGYGMLSTTSFVGMGDVVTKETFEWIFSEPEIAKASSIVCRLMDDMVSHKFEQKRGHVASAIECYTKQHGVSEEEACEEFRRQVTDAWKAITQECLKPTAIPMPILTRVLNLARVIDVVYKDEDGYTHAGIVLKDYISSLLIEPLDEFGIEHAQKLKEVRKILLSKLAGEEDPLEGLVMIDTIQRLGIDYHFQEEIETLLQRQYVLMSFSGGEGGDSDHDLYQFALRFRLLRQEGYYVHAGGDMFNNFKDKEGNFKQNLSEDIRGLMGLYEASQLSVEGEDMLVEAGDFSSQLLNACMAHLNHHEARVVANTLKYPYHKSLSRFMAKNFLSNFQGTNEWINPLQELTRLDFNMVQSINQKEILQISKWWNDLGLAKELKLARDQPLKWYMWPMAILTDPRLSQQRVDLTKPISLVYIIDDIFDIYGTVDELTLFTEAVTRWEPAAVDQLPDYMKTCFKALYDITNEIGYNFFKEHGWNPIDILRKTWTTLCNAFLVEAKWFACGHMPKAEEYLKNGVVSSGVHVVLVHMFFLLGNGVTKETVGLMNEGIPGIIYFTAMILRLWDDLGSAKDENQDGNDGSYVECYMKEHQGCSVESAREHIVHMIPDTWKCLNKECFSSNPFPSSFTKACLNAARMVPLMYSYDDNHGLPSLEQHMKSLLYESF